MIRLMHMFLTAALLVGCASATVEHNVGEAVSLDFGTTANFSDGFRMTFTHVSDSRCPADVTCIQAGEALIELTCSFKNESQVVHVSTDRRKDHVEVLGHVIELMSIRPGSRQHSVAPEKYSVTLRATTR
jgi:hypothetical protein